MRALCLYRECVRPSTIRSPGGRCRDGLAGRGFADQDNRRPHLLPADTVLAAHLAPHLALQQSQLNARLQTTQAHNAKLFADIQKQRAELEALVSLLEKLFADIDGASRALDGVVDDLAKETRTVEVEMSGT